MSDEKVDQVGRCPKCGKMMVDIGKFVVCPNGDYKANFEKLDNRWNNFNAKTDSAETLLTDLLALNLVEVSQ